MLAQRIDTNIEEKKLVSKLTSNRTGNMANYTAIYLVSVGKKNFEGEAVTAAMKMINIEFKECFIVVADTLQRHNISTEKDVSDENAYQESLQNGSEWIKKYEQTFKNFLSIPYKIIRWDDLINCNEFKSREKSFVSKLDNSKTLSDAMKSSITEYGVRLKKRLGEECFQKIALKHWKNCFTYLQEECVAITLFPKTIKANSENITPFTIVYPGKSTQILTANREIFIKSEYPDVIANFNDFLNWLSFRFNKIKEKKDESIITLKVNNTDHKNRFEDLEKINLINRISENQLLLIEKTLDQDSLNNFKRNLMQHLLSKKETDSHNKSSLENILIDQVMSIFETVDKKVANKCKANIVRILKKENIPIDTVAQ